MPVGDFLCIDGGTQARAIFWLKPACDEHRSRLWELAHFIRQQGRFTELLAVPHPGQIVYEDDFQVAAVPCWTPGSRNHLPGRPV